MNSSYDGVVFHRISKDFIIQAGAEYADGSNTPDTPVIRGEFKSNNFNNNIGHTKGTLSMARSSDPNSASNQFFICTGNPTFLDPDYAAFGRLVDGLDTLDQLNNTPREEHSLERPVDPPVMIKVYIAK